MKLNGTHQLLVYAINLIILNPIKRKRDVLLGAAKDAGSE
jgi:hypothetical protein